MFNSMPSTLESSLGAEEVGHSAPRGAQGLSVAKRNELQLQGGIALAEEDICMHVIDERLNASKE